MNRINDKYGSYLLAPIILLLFSCQPDREVPLDPELVSLLSPLEQEFVPLDDDPLAWEDDDLAFLDPMADKLIVGLGEATHGTAEFFNAKRRIFQYLVENHGYKVFAFEADFGESLFIEEAVQQGRKSEIRGLMSERMHFWTWRTQEVRRLLEWMSEYNVGKPEEEKVHYMGVDCQYNTYHPELLMQYLQDADASFADFAGEVLEEVMAASEAGFEGYSSEEFTAYINRLDALQDSMVARQNTLVAATSEKDFALHLRLLRLVRQVSEVQYSWIDNYLINYRDKYMAENTAWLLDYFAGEKVVLWAHNGHIANDPNYGPGSLGHYLLQKLPNDYMTVSFMFSQGEFTARGYENDQNTALTQHTITEEPKSRSLNELFHYANRTSFTVRVSDLLQHSEWNERWAKDRRRSVLPFSPQSDEWNERWVEDLYYLSIGAVFDGQPEHYYSRFHPSRYDQIIYFDHTTASQPFD